MTRFELNQGYDIEPPNKKDFVKLIVVIICIFIIIAYQLYNIYSKKKKRYSKLLSPILEGE